MAQLVEQYPDDVRLIYRHFPLPSHTNSQVAAYASEAAGLQGKFYEMTHAIFERQDQLGALTVEDAEAWLADLAGELSLDVAKFEADLQSDAVKQRVERDYKVSQDAQLPGTPFLFINGIPYQQQMDFTTLLGIVDLFKLAERQYTACPPMIIDADKEYQATLETDQGEVVIKLFAAQAPLAVNSFVFLAQQGWFDGVTFHRVLPDFVAQGGDPSGSGFGGPGYQFRNENAEAKFDRKGLVAMANGGADTNGSQFFITFAPAEDLNGGYTIFGEVIEGMDVVEKFTQRDPASGAELPPGTRILNVTVAEK